MMKHLPRTKGCFVCGTSNPAGLALRFETDGTEVLGRHVFKKEHCGFKQTVHGGLVATLLDEIMVWACGVQTGQFAFCAELGVRFQAPVRPGEEITIVAGPVMNRRNRVFQATAEVRDSTGKVLATGTGKYMPVPESAMVDLLADFEFDPRGELGGGKTKTPEG